MATEIEITKITDDGWVQGRIVNPTGDYRYLSVRLEMVMAPPNTPRQDNGHVFRPGIGTARSADDPWLKVGDFVMVAV